MYYSVDVYVLWDRSKILHYTKNVVATYLLHASHPR